MPEAVLFTACVLTVIGGRLLWTGLRRHGVQRETPTLDVQNHIGDPRDPTSGVH